jgi:hypothetical protein
MVATTQQLVSPKGVQAPVPAPSELDLTVRHESRSAFPSICAILVLMLVELAWFGLLLFLARKLIVG